MVRLRLVCKVGGAFCLAGMTLLTCVDVVGRKLGHPIFGSVELVGFMATLAAALALPYTHHVQGHIGVEIVVKNFSERTQKTFDFFTNILGLVFFSLVTWRMFVYAGTIRASGEVSISLKFPEYLIILAVAVSFLIFVLTIFEEIVSISRQLKEKS
ncbi:MAG: TRAP transporter small permease [Deltaproteobacteria bacterium]|nr:TRAP transporter small permease [Deltaproteobacteria bacterium]MBW1956138.1 TRAP transporter small permease [Deltaproteobacteria bacterium]MBW2042649.1 TRAP transporter small permease [Deltaproteobacteria bacterium]MBW2132738.1 TRAP transporter small permease [Deltaproteobacteria bacterium]